MTISGYPIPLEAIKQWRGDPLELVLRLQTVDGTKVDLSGYGSAWSAMARENLRSAEHVDFTVDVSKISDPTDPRLTLSLTDVQTKAMTDNRYGFDVQATGGTVSPFTVWRGSLNMDGEYTHA